ncbi:DUF397 domain-containing protein [Streptomyces sp. NBRC 109706]|uniref:DUF397 domain-containing protein n=1 Tax=Streptomyces sp. NBRC 109706 TaxID=1550035 RepID=UPI0007865499|nr:DUF397 domain-containing protein [Streptomyces sp. NBRC 109706]
MQANQATWFKSSYSAENGDCVEIRSSLDGVQSRDSKDHNGPLLAFKADGWAAFLSALNDEHYFEAR